MATEIRLVDDLDGSRNGVGTARFVWDDVAYAVDLSEDNRAEFDAFLRKHADAGRRLGRFRVTLKDDGAIAPTPVAPKSGHNGTVTALAVATAVDGGDAEWYRHKTTDAPDLSKRKATYRRNARDHAKDHGIDVPQRGRTPIAVFRAYDEHCERNGLPVGPASVGITTTKRATG